MICSSLNLDCLIVRLLQGDRTLLIFGGSSGAQVKINKAYRGLAKEHGADEKRLGALNEARDRAIELAKHARRVAISPSTALPYSPNSFRFRDDKEVIERAVTSHARRRFRRAGYATLFAAAMGLLGGLDLKTSVIEDSFLPTDFSEQVRRTKDIFRYASIDAPPIDVLRQYRTAPEINRALIEKAQRHAAQYEALLPKELPEPLRMSAKEGIQLLSRLSNTGYVCDLSLDGICESSRGSPTAGASEREMLNSLFLSGNGVEKLIAARQNTLDYLQREFVDIRAAKKRAFERYVGWFTFFSLLMAALAGIVAIYWKYRVRKLKDAIEDFAGEAYQGRNALGLLEIFLSSDQLLQGWTESDLSANVERAEAGRAFKVAGPFSGRRVELLVRHLGATNFSRLLIECALRGGIIIDRGINSTAERCYRVEANIRL